MQVRIYNKDLTPLATFFQSELEQVSFTNSLKSTGSGTLLLRVDNPKLTPTILAMYNRVKFFDGSKAVFYGFITEAQYTLDVVELRLVSIAEILQNRTTGGSFFASGSMPTVITALLAQVNSVANTGISIGNIPNIFGTYSKTYNSGETVTAILDDLFVNDLYQYYIDSDGKLHANTLLGNNLSATVSFKYDIAKPQNANLTSFKVTESSQRILTKITALNDSVYPVQTVQDSALIAKYGVVEATRKYYYVYSTPEITVKANADLKGASYSPELSLSPSIEDNFYVTDQVKVRLKSSLIDVTEVYQIIEKSVTFIGGEKRITVKLNDQQKNLVDLLLEQKDKVKLLENK